MNPNFTVLTHLALLGSAGHISCSAAVTLKTVCASYALFLHIQVSPLRIRFDITGFFLSE